MSWWNPNPDRGTQSGLFDPPAGAGAGPDHELTEAAGTDAELARFLDGKPLAAASSNISEATYQADARLLTITYHDGSVYGYRNVSPALAAAYYRAPSKGKWRHANLPKTWDYFRIQ